MRALSVAVVMTAASILSPQAQQTGGSIGVPAGARVVLEARGEGVQIYTCSEAQSGFKWVLAGPDARLFDLAGRQIGIHFAGPTWKLTDGSTVVGEVIANRLSPEASSVAWLLLRAKSGTATGQLAGVEFIRRTGTHGGVAAPSECQTRADAAKTVRVPYTATYTFYSQK
jgi:Protein of unknown function (DUF3455)